MVSGICTVEEDASLKRRLHDSSKTTYLVKLKHDYV